MTMYQMNPQRAKHMNQDAAPPPKTKDALLAPAKDDAEQKDAAELPTITISPSGTGHTVHILHADGQPDEKHDIAEGDSDGIIALVKQHTGNSSSADSEGIDLDDSGDASTEELAV